MRLIENEWRYFDEVLNIPYPWYTKPCLEWLECISLKGKKIWEYGAGDSTKWYRTSKAIVKGVDSNRDYQPKGIHFAILQDEYTQAISKKGPFDFIIIDGIWRDHCTEFALKELREGGYLIIDNYKQASADLLNWPKTEKLIEGMEITLYKEPDHPDWCTAVIRK